MTGYCQRAARDVNQDSVDIGICFDAEKGDQLDRRAKGPSSENWTQKLGFKVVNLSLIGPLFPCATGAIVVSELPCNLLCGSAFHGVGKVRQCQSPGKGSRLTKFGSN